jgi:hypothetical protein
MANTNPFDDALKAARKALREAYEERAGLEQRIISLTKTIEGLAALCEPEVVDEFLITAEGDVANFQIASLTDAIRQVFSSSSEPMLTPTEVRDALVARGMDFSKYRQPLVPIHNTLKRLVSQEELVEFRDDSGDLRGYRWVSPLARAVAEVSPQRYRTLVGIKALALDPDKFPEPVRSMIHPKADIDAMRKIKDRK